MRSLSTSLLFTCSLVAALGLGCEGRNGATNDDVSKKTADEPGVGSTPANAERLSDKSQEFVMAAGRHDMLEVELGQLAQQRAQITAVKDFAGQLVQHHRKAKDELQQVVGERQALPTSMSDDEQKTKDELAKTEAADFDEEYIDAVIDHHQEAIDDFEDQAERTDEPKLQQYAASHLALLRQHLDEAKRIKGQDVAPKQQLFD